MYFMCPHIIGKGMTDNTVNKQLLLRNPPRTTAKGKSQTTPNDQYLHNQDQHKDEGRGECLQTKCTCLKLFAQTNR